MGQSKQRNPLQGHGATATGNTTEQRGFVESTYQLARGEIDGQPVSGLTLIDTN